MTMFGRQNLALLLSLCCHCVVDDGVLSSLEISLGPLLGCFRPFELVPLNVLKTRPVTESEKLSVHSSLVGPVVERRLNR